MKSLIKNYINNLTIEKLDKFAKSKDINLSSSELEYLLFLAKNNLDDILKDDTKYLDSLKENLSSSNYEKVIELYNYYKNRYKGYLF